MNKLRIHFNSPVILTYTLLSLALVVISLLTGNWVLKSFGLFYSSWADPRMYLRMLSHILVHADFEHFVGNFMFILAIGPMVEEKYGSKRLLQMILLTALITAAINLIFFRNILLVGASGVVFMLILLASFVNIQEKRIPLTVILVAVLFIGNEIVNGIIANDNISQLSHIIGGLCGGVFGYVLSRKRLSQTL